MILPIGHEHATVRRMPWVTLGVVLLCLVVQLGMVTAKEAERALQASWRSALEFALSHPHLRVDPALVPADLRARLDAARRSTAPPAAAALAAQQRQLDQLTAVWRQSLERHPLWRGGLVPAAPTLGGLFTHMFLHAGWLHLIGNMLFLYLAAPFVEDLWSRPRFAAFYLSAGVVAGGLYALSERQAAVPLVGASGAVAGVLGAFLLLRGRSRIHFAVFLGFIGTFAAPAWVMVPLWFFFQLLDALASDIGDAGAGGGVAYWAHVWGFVYGVVFTAVAQRVRPVAAAALPPPRRDTRLDEAHRLLDRGLYPRAWTLLAEAATQPSPDPEALADYWALAVHLGREREALPAARELLRRYLRDHAWSESAALLVQLAEAMAGDPELPALQLRAADGLAASDPEAAARLLTAARAGSTLPPGLAAKATRIAERLAGAASATPSSALPS